MPKTCEKILKLYPVPLLKLIFTVDQVSAPVTMSMCRLSTLSQAVDPQELTSDLMLKIISAKYLKSKNDELVDWMRTEEDVKFKKNKIQDEQK